ncbi:YhgE/Pip domain-containing protein [Microbacterium oleivorans]|uniref:YhgE/Pip domain-containing protein n=1 Tax=Microbacterium oleivorans TaxID=273677 RepID=UPI0007671A34|nr:YhgE/Pip domain-containing protein [Microbacterium oleivorans]
MTLPIERAQTRRPISWLTLLGVLLLPAVIGGILVAALYNPTERLDALNTAIVNNDEPVEVNGQTTPLGRLLTAGLVKGSDDLDSNLTWTISNTEDAEEGLADGTYDAIVTIPKNFSAAATSTAPGKTPERATIDLEASPDARIVDDAITSQVTSTAASVLGERLTTGYLENVFLGFTTLNEQLGKAADGATQLADGANGAADGAAKLADGASTASDGGYSLADGIRKLQSGAAGIATGADGIATGASDLATGAHRLADGAGAAADGIDTLAGGADKLAGGAAATSNGLNEWSAGARPIAEGTQQLADGLAQAAEQTAAIPAIPSDLVDGLKALSADGEQNSQAVTSVVDALSAAADSCVPAQAGAELCDQLKDASAQATKALPQLQKTVSNSEQLAKDLDALANFGPNLNKGLSSSAAAAQKLAGGMNELADGADQLAGGAGALSSGASGLADGAGQAATGVRKLADGADQLAGGADQLSSGAGQLATGAQAFAVGAGSAAEGTDKLAGGVDALATGAGDLSTGVDKLADGTGDLATGLDKAVDGVPTYTKTQAADLASIVAKPVVADGAGTALFGASAVPLLATLALWFGGLASFVVLRAVPRTALASRRSSASLALRALAPGALIGALQGVLVAIIVQLAAGYDMGAWWLFAAMCVLAGVAFAAVNHALVALFGGIGRWIAALVGVLALATGIVSTVPGTLLDVAGLLPTAPAYTAMLAALTDAGGGASAAVGLVLWTVLAIGAGILAVTRHRSTSARAVLTRPA